MRTRLLAVAVLAAALLVPATMAQAATVTEESGATVYRGEGAEGLSLLVSTYQDYMSGTTYLSLGDSGANRQVVLSGACFKSTGYDPRILCPLNPTKPLKIYGSAADDALDIFSSDVPDSMPIQIHGLAGDDQIEDAYDSDPGRLLTGGPGEDLIEGHGGSDAIDGGDGNDEVDGGEGDDQVRGGPGDDMMWGDHYHAPGADLLDGGPGIDTAQEWGRPELLDRQPAVNVTIDGVANDGRPGEGDNVVGIERLDLYVVGSFTGTEGADRIKIVNPGNDGPSRLIGRGGDDLLVANDFDDTVDGGVGNDTVEGGHGNDHVTGGPGQDVIYGDATSAHCGWYSCKVPFGNDVINARDGEADSVDCGIGTDQAIVDAIDVIANCENVQGGPGDGPAGDLAVAVDSGKTPRALAGGGVTLAVECPAACDISGALHVDRKAARNLKLRGGSTKVGGGKGSAASAGTARATLKVTGRAKRRFRRLAKAKVTVRVTVRHAGGGVDTAARKLTVRR